MTTPPKTTTTKTSCSEGYQVRPASAADFEPLFWLHSLVHARHALPEDRLRRYLSRPPTGLGAYVAAQGRYLRGYLLYQTGLPHTRLVDVAVCPGHRRKGVATILVLMLRRQHPHPSALVRERNLPGQMLLKQAGFRWVSTRPRRFGKDCDGYLLQA
jgi:ribosomal protein S18 acetylase RimI-like enzyme